MGVSTSVLGLVFQTLAVALFTYYLTVDGPRLRYWLCTFMWANRQRELMRLSDIAIDRTSAYLSYRIALAMLSTIVHSLFFQSVGLPSAVALGLWVGVISQFVPTIGTYIAAFLPILVALTQDLRTTVAVVAFILVYQQIENYVISPRLGRRALKVHPAVGFGAALAAAAVLGPSARSLPCQWSPSSSRLPAHTFTAMKSSLRCGKEPQAARRSMSGGIRSSTAATADNDVPQAT